MEIFDERKCGKKELNSLEENDCFFYEEGGDISMVTDETDDEGRIRCVCLDDGLLFDAKPSDKVYKVNIKISMVD